MSDDIQKAIEQACELLKESGYENRIDYLLGRVGQCNDLTGVKQVIHTVLHACNLD